MYKISILTALFLALSFPALAESFEMGAPGKLTVDIAKGWTVLGKKIGSEGFNLDIRPDAEINAAGKITVIFLREEQDLTPDQIKERLAGVLTAFKESSVEKEADIHPFNLKSGTGFYASFTDASLVGKPSKPGDYKVMTSGLIYLSSRLLVTVTLFSDEKSGKDYAELLKMIESMSLAVSV